MKNKPKSFRRMRVGELNKFADKLPPGEELDWCKGLLKSLPPLQVVDADEAMLDRIDEIVSASGSGAEGGKKQ